jgi:hypothetical protein
MAQYIGTTVITSVIAGTNCSGGGTAGAVTVNVDDAFLVNDGSDTTTGTITAAGFTTTGTWTFDEYTSGTIGITTIQDSGTTYNDNDTSLMTAGAISDYVTGLGYSAGDITSVIGGTNCTVSGGASGDATVNVDDAFVKNNADDVMTGALTVTNGAGIIINDATTSSATEGGKLVLAADDGAVMDSGHRLGVIEFKGAEDTGSTLTIGARIEALTDAAWSASENGADLVFYTTDGNASETEQMRCTASTGVSIPKRKINVSTTTDGNVGSGDVVYFGSGTVVVGKIYHYKSDASWELADANTVANCDGLLGVATASGTASAVGMLLRGMITLIDIQGTEAVGDVLYLSESATGAADCVAPAGSGDIVRVIGYCLTTDDQIWFNPDNTYVELA